GRDRAPPPRGGGRLARAGPSGPVRRARRAAAIRRPRRRASPSSRSGEGAVPAAGLERAAVRLGGERFGLADLGAHTIRPGRAAASAGPTGLSLAALIGETEPARWGRQRAAPVPPPGTGTGVRC